MDHVVIAGRPYACPFAGLLRPLTPDELAYLRASIRDQGVRVPVITYRSPAHGPALVDGHNRAAIGHDLALPVPVTDLGPLDDHAAGELAVQLNAARRQFTPGEVEQLYRDRTARIVRVLAARLAGESLRTIAHREGVSSPQILADIRDAPARGLTTDPMPDVVVGRDGREYPATRPPPDPLKEARATALQAAAVADGYLSLVHDWLAGPLAEHLRKAARKRGVPIDGKRWGALVQVTAAVAAAARDV